MSNHCASLGGKKHPRCSQAQQVTAELLALETALIQVLQLSQLPTCTSEPHSLPYGSVPGARKLKTLSQKISLRNFYLSRAVVSKAANGLLYLKEKKKGVGGEGGVGYGKSNSSYLLPLMSRNQNHCSVPTEKNKDLSNSTASPFKNTNTTRSQMLCCEERETTLTGALTRFAVLGTETVSTPTGHDSS